MCALRTAQLIISVQSLLKARSWKLRSSEFARVEAAMVRRERRAVVGAGSLGVEWAIASVMVEGMLPYQIFPTQEDVNVVI